MSLLIHRSPNHLKLYNRGQINNCTHNYMTQSLWDIAKDSQDLSHFDVSNEAAALASGSDDPV